MTAKQFLSQAHRLEQRINSDVEELSSWRELIKTVNTVRPEEHYNPNHSIEAAFTRRLEKIWDLEQRINEEIDQLVDMKDRIRSVIDMLDNYDEQMVLRYRYLHNFEWDKIAAKMQFSVSWVYKLHHRALSQFEKIFEEDSKVQ